MNKSTFLFLLFLGIVFGACKKDSDNAFNEKRNNIIGTWEVTQASQEIRADTVAVESSSNFEITFNGDGTGVQESFLGFPVDFEWLYQFNPEKVVISFDQVNNLLSSVQFYEVTKNESDRQIWEFEVVLENQVVDKYKHTWKMDKK